MRPAENALFAGHEAGAENRAMLASLVATCKMSDINPVTYLAATLRSRLDDHPRSRIEDLMSWASPRRDKRRRVADLQSAWLP